MRGRRSIQIEGLSSVDLTARMLSAACALNLNGFIALIFDVEQGFSIFMLVSSLYLLVKFGGASQPVPLQLLILAIATYLLLATLFDDGSTSIYPPEKVYFSYLGSIFIIWALTGYVASLTPGPKLFSFLRFLRNMFLISAASVWASPILYEFYAYLPPSAGQRMAGFFGNPVEAAIASLLAIALTIWVPIGNRNLHLILLVMASTSVVLTLSKTGMVCLAMFLTWRTFHWFKGQLSVAALPVVAILFISVFLYLNDFLEFTAQIPELGMNQSQQDRIIEVGQILGGQVDDTTSTGRTYVWRMVLENSFETFPFGQGIGKAHQIVGGILEDDQWQGVHNTFLLMLGEAGVIPALLLVASILALFGALLRRGDNVAEIAILFILLIDMMSTHGSLIARNDNLMLAVLIGLAANPRPEWREADLAIRVSTRGAQGT